MPLPRFWKARGRSSEADPIVPPPMPLHAPAAPGSGGEGGLRPDDGGPALSVELMGPTVVATVLSEHLEASAAMELAAELLHFLNANPGARHVVLDMQSVKYLNSAGLNALVALFRRIHAQGGRIAIARAGASVGTLFKLTRLDRLFLLRGDVLDAISAVETAA